MAIITNTVTSFSGSPGIVGAREDLADMIYNVSPTETPFTNNVGRGKASNTIHEWQTQSLVAASTANAQIQGDDLGTTGFDAANVSTRLNNRTQISRKSVVVDNTVLALTLAGRKSEMALQIQIKSKELKRDIEAILVGTNQAKVTGNSTTAPTLASVLSWIKTNTSKGASGVDPSAADGTGTRTDGTQRSFTEDLLETVVQLQWTNSGEALDVLMVGGALKQSVSAFAGNNNRMIDAKGKQLQTAVDLYSYDFGTLKVVPNRFMRTRDALLLDYSMWSVDWLRPIRMQDIAATGDAEKRLIVGEYTLAAKNEASSGGVFDLQ